MLPCLFAASGCAALIYQIVWFEQLGLVIGASAISLGLTLAVFMGGMCIGSLWLPRLVAAARQPLRVYAALELGVGMLGIAALVVIPAVGNLYVAAVRHRGPRSARGDGRRVPVARDHPDGRHAAGRRALCRRRAKCECMGRRLLRREHSGRRARLHAERVLPAALLRRVRRDGRRGAAERRSCDRRVAACARRRCRRS